MSEFESGERVRYVGGIQRLKGLEGRFVGYQRNGWACVDFERFTEGGIAPANLERVEKQTKIRDLPPGAVFQIPGVGGIYQRAEDGQGYFALVANGVRFMDYEGESAIELKPVTES